MHSSIDGAFAAVAFPRIDGAGSGAPIDPAQAAQLNQQARVHGHAAGYAEGLRAAAMAAERQQAERDAAHAALNEQHRAGFEQALAALALAIAAVQRTAAPVLAECDQALVAAGLELAEAVIGHELSDAETAAAAAVHRVLTTLGADSTLPGIVLSLNPDDAAALAAAGQLPPGLTVTPDLALGRGDALAVLPDGLLDARIATALQRARLALLEDAE